MESPNVIGEKEEIPAEASGKWLEWLNARKIDYLTHRLDDIEVKIKSINARIARVQQLIIKKKDVDEDEVEKDPYAREETELEELTREQLIKKYMQEIEP